MKIYDGNRYDTTDSASDCFLKINSCGIQRKEPGDRVIRKKGRQDYQLIMVRYGILRVWWHGTESTLRTGNLLLYEPGEPNDYSAETETETLWIHFTGSAAEEILNTMGLAPGVFENCFPGRIFEEGKRIAEQFHQPKRKKFVYGSFLTFLAAISEELHEEAPPEGAETIFEVLSYIQSGYEKKMTLEELAKRSGYSKSRFSHLFSKVTGSTPLAYQRALRMQKACELLSATALSVREIAGRCGFEDALYFCRAFRKDFGMSPSEYRERGR